MPFGSQFEAFDGSKAPSSSSPKVMATMATIHSEAPFREMDDADKAGTGLAAHALKEMSVSVVPEPTKPVLGNQRKRSAMWFMEDEETFSDDSDGENDPCQSKNYKYPFLARGSRCRRKIYTCRIFLISLLFHLIAVIFLVSGWLGSHEAGSTPECPRPRDFWLRAGCELTVSFVGMDCATVQKEVLARIQGQDDWVDPHGRGEYKLLSRSNPSGHPLEGFIQGSHHAGDGQSVDKFGLKFTEMGGCIMSACSISPTVSIWDKSMNYCNIRNLYCGSADNCQVVHNDLSAGNGFEEQTSGKCWTRDVRRCNESNVRRI